MKNKVFKLLFIMLLSYQNAISQGILTSTDNSVNAVIAGSTTIPKTENGRQCGQQQMHIGLHH